MIGPKPAVQALRLVLVLTSLPLSALAQQATFDRETGIQVPGEDIFGFTSGADTGSVGDRGVALENDLRSGKRDGRYRALNQKLEFSGTFAENWSAAASLFGDVHQIEAVSQFPDRRPTYEFDGVAVEVRRRLIERAAGQPFSITAALEPRWARFDGGSGWRARSFSAEAKLQADVPISGSLFGAINLHIGIGRQQEVSDRARYAVSSWTSISSAVAYEAMPDRIYVGMEARWVHSYERALGSLAGHGLYLGPTFLLKPSPSTAFNLTAQPQLLGRSRNTPGRLDLDSLESANFRAKFTVAF